jgi:hypothetical protein
MAFPSIGSTFMQPIVANVAALAVATLFYLWRSHYETRRQRQRLLRQRVAFLLWVLAERDEAPDPRLSLNGHG